MLRSSKLSDVFESAYFLNVCYRTYHWLPSPCITAGLRHVYWDRIMVITWVHQCQPKYLHFVCQYYAHMNMNICPPASVCVCVWLPTHRPTCEHLGELRLELRHAPLGQTWDCIIGGKATTLTWAYSGIVVRQGSRFLGLPKAITYSFFSLSTHIWLSHGPKKYPPISID